MKSSAKASFQPGGAMVGMFSPDGEVGVVVVVASNTWWIGVRAENARVEEAVALLTGRLLADAATVVVEKSAADNTTAADTTTPG